MNPQCPGCCSDRIAEGRFSEIPCSFELPPQEKGFFATVGPSFELKKSAFACVECGLVWTQADRSVITRVLARGGSDELLEQLRIPARPKRRWLWLLCGRR